MIYSFPASILLALIFMIGINFNFQPRTLTSIFFVYLIPLLLRTFSFLRSLCFVIFLILLFWSLDLRQLALFQRLTFLKHFYFLVLLFQAFNQLTSSSLINIVSLSLIESLIFVFWTKSWSYINN